MKRRPYGTGSIFERSPGVFILRVNAAADPVTGARRRPTKTVHGTRKQAQEALDKMKAALGQVSEPAKVTVGQLIDALMEVREIAPGTRQDWDRVIRMYIRPQLEHVELRKFTSHRVDAHYAELRRAGVSAWRILKAHEILSVACDQAIDWGWLATSPARSAQRPKKPAKKARGHSDAAVMAMAAKAFTDKVWGLWFHLAFVTGARRAELAALTWADVDLDDHTVTFDKAAVSISGIGTLIEPTKTKEWRIVPLDDETIELLRAQQLRHREKMLGLGERWHSGLHVLTHRRRARGDRPIRPDAATHWFERMREQVAKTHPAAARIRLGDLRHLASSEMQKAGIETTVVAEILGNDPATVRDHYSHTLDGRKRTAIEGMAALAKQRRTVKS